MDRVYSGALLDNPRELLDDDLRDSHLIAVHQVIQAIARQQDTRETLPLIVSKAQLLTAADSVAIVLLDATRSYLDFVAISGADALEKVGQRVLVDDALMGPTALTGEIYIAENLTLSQPLLPSHDPDQSMAFGVRSAAVVPIFLSGASVGALAAINRVDGISFTAVDVLRLQMFAAAVSVALGQERLRTETRHQKRARNILVEATRAGSATLNVQEVLQSILTTVGGSIEMSAGAVFLVNDERTRLYVAADLGLSDDDRDRQIEADAGWAAQILNIGSPRCIRDTEDSDIGDDLPIPGMRSLLIAPLSSRSSAEGLIVIGSRLPGSYTEHDADMLLAVAGHAAISLENAWLFEDATRRAQEATAIYELSQSVGATLQLEKVLDFVADSVLSLLYVDKFALFLFNERAGRLEIKIARNLSDEVVNTMQPRLGEGIAGWVMEFQTPTAVQDLAADHRNRSMPIDQEGVTSLVSVPLQVGDKIVGVLQAMSSRRRLFTVGEMELLYTISNQAATAIGNAQAYQVERQTKEELRKSIRRVARVLGSSTDVEKGAQMIADLAIEMVNADRSILYTLDSRDRVVLRAAANFRPVQGSMGVEGAPQSATAWVARRCRSLMIDSVQADTRFVWPDYVTPDRVSSYLGVPLRLGKDTVGVLEVYSREPRRFLSEEVRSLLTFASQASVGLKNALLVEQAARRLQDLDALNAISARLFNSAIPELFEETLALVCRATDSDIGLACVFGEDELRIVHHAPSATGVDVEKESVAVDVALLELAHWVRRYGGSTRLSTVDVPSGEICAVALALGKDKGDSRAAIVLSRVAPSVEYDERDRRFLETVANLLSGRLV